MPHILELARFSTTFFLSAYAWDEETTDWLIRAATLQSGKLYEFRCEWNEADNTAPPGS